MIIVKNQKLMTPNFQIKSSDCKFVKIDITNNLLWFTSDINNLDDEEFFKNNSVDIIINGDFVEIIGELQNSYCLNKFINWKIFLNKYFGFIFKKINTDKWIIKHTLVKNFRYIFLTTGWKMYIK